MPIELSSRLFIYYNMKITIDQIRPGQVYSTSSYMDNPLIKITCVRFIGSNRPPTVPMIDWKRITGTNQHDKYDTTCDSAGLNFFEDCVIGRHVKKKCVRCT